MAATPELDDDAIKVLIVDDHALFRRGIQMVLEQEDDIDVVGEATDGQHAFERAEELMPDVVLMDVRMPKRTGIEATRQIKDVLPHAKILMLTVSDEEEDLYEAIKAGASGYLLKEISIEEVADAIRKVHAGQSLISPSMASKLLTEFASMAKKDEEKQQMPAPRLTDREMEVLTLVAQGLNNRDIAKELFISENTVKNHVRNILEKLHLRSRLDADLIVTHPHLVRIEHRATRLDVKLPAMPWTLNNLVVPPVDILIGFGRDRCTRDNSKTERSALMRATVPKCVVLPIDVEYTNGTHLKIDNSSRPWGKLTHSRYRMATRHCNLFIDLINRA
jgi:DNA-binding NarL/FixJ family response regulator